MKVKTYRAANIQQALNDIKKELGPDAFILGRKEIHAKKILGMFGRSSVEVTAAVDFADAAPDPATLVPDSVNLHVTAASPPVTESDSRFRPGDSQDNQVLLEEIRKLQCLIQSIPSAARRDAVSKTRQFPTSASEEVYDELLYSGMDEDLVQDLVEAACSDCNPKVADDKSALRSEIESRLGSLISIEQDSGSTGTPRVIALVGPTGVGKTTTLAKLAAKAALQDGLKVALLTTDTYRIGAVSQLKTYAEIIGIPIGVTETVSDLEQGLNKFSNKDLVLIDTAGRSPKAVFNQWELAEFLSRSKDIRKILVLSATTKQADMAEIVEKYKIFDPACLLFTKLDETDVYGPMLYELVRSRKPIAYVTTGQNVPKDIFQPTVSQLATLSFGVGNSQVWRDMLSKNDDVRGECSA